MNGIEVATNAWPIIEQRLAAGDPGVIPIGAASKEHGRHLPSDTDFRQAEWIANRVREQFPVVVWPTVTYGYYPVFVEYPGSISVREDTFRALLGDIIDGVERAGATRVILLNTGISTIAPLEALLEERGGGRRVRLVNVYAGPAFARASKALAEQDWGGHADEIETSIMLALAPDRVDMRAARPAPSRIVRGLFNRVDPDGENYSPDGVNGNPTLATREKGAALLEAMLEDVAAVLANI